MAKAKPKSPAQQLFDDVEKFVREAIEAKYRELGVFIERDFRALKFDSLIFRVSKKEDGRRGILGENTYER